MKKNNLLVSGVLLGIFFLNFYACSQQADVLDEREKMYESNYELVGRLHNEGVEYIFQQLASKQTKSVHSAEIDVEHIHDLCRNFVEQQGYETEKIVPTRAANPTMDYRQIEFEFTEHQNYYLKRLEKAIEGSTFTGLEDLIQDIKKLEEELVADVEMPDCEKDVLLYGAAVCRYSARYWSENYEKWAFEFKNISHRPRTKSGQEYVVSQSWWEKNKHIVTADGWWAMQGCMQSASSATLWYIIGMTLGEGIAGSVLAVLGD